MKQMILKHRNALAALVTTLVVGTVLMSFQDSPLVHGKYDQQQSYTDTVPDKDQNDHMKMKDFEKLMTDLDTKVMLEVGDALKNIDFAKIENDVEKSIKSIDMEKIMKDVERSLKDIDLDKIMSD